jgi:hypothetical protein
MIPIIRPAALPWDLPVPRRTSAAATATKVTRRSVRFATGGVQFDRKATIGSIREARQAGMYPASAATAKWNLPACDLRSCLKRTP